MTVSEQTSRPVAGQHFWLANQPYILLSITALCWAGNAIVGRLAAGHIPPVTLSFLRWFFAFLLILPLARKHLVRDWPSIRTRLPWSRRQRCRKPRTFCCWKISKRPAAIGSARRSKRCCA